jgi:hypothetical protein
VRSGGYTKNNELEDALFAFGRNYTEVKEFPKCRLPTGIVNLLRRKKLDKIALETGFFKEISIKKPVSSAILSNFFLRNKFTIPVGKRHFGNSLTSV